MFLENNYYFNVIKEVIVKDDFLDLDKNVRGCQKETYDDCTTTEYIDRIISNCGCLPFQIKLGDEAEVIIIKSFEDTYINISETSLYSSKNGLCKKPQDEQYRLPPTMFRNAHHKL